MKTILFLTLFSLTSLGQNWLKISAGYVSGHLIHEVGHIAVHEIYNHNYQLKINQRRVLEGTYIRINQNVKNNEAQLSSTAGFLSTSIAAEVAFMGNNSDFKTGLILHTIVNPLIYVVRQKIDKDYGDIGYFRRKGGDVTKLRVALVSYSILNATRLYFKLNRISPYVSYNEVGVAYRL